MAANLRRAGHELTVWNRTRGDGRGVGGRARRDGRGHARRGRRSAPRSCSRWSSTARRCRRCCSAMPRAGARGRAVRRHVDDRRRRGRGASATQLAERGARWSTRRSPARRRKAEDGTLTIMCRRRADGRRPRPAAAGGDGRADRPRRPARRTGQTVKLINNAVAAANAATAGPGAARRRSAQGVDLDALVEVMGGGLGRLARCSRSRPARCATTTTRRSSRLEHMLKDVRLCLEEAQAAGRPVPGRRGGPRRCSRRRWAADTATTTSRRCSRSLEGARRTTRL